MSRRWQPKAAARQLFHNGILPDQSGSYPDALSTHYSFDREGCRVQAVSAKHFGVEHSMLRPQTPDFFTRLPPHQGQGIPSATPSGSADTRATSSSDIFRSRASSPAACLRTPNTQARSAFQVICLRITRPDPPG